VANVPVLEPLVSLEQAARAAPSAVRCRKMILDAMVLATWPTIRDFTRQKERRD
jgi:hypothetical protein